MEPKSGEPERGASDGDETAQDDSDDHERVIRGPTGFRVVSETTAEALLGRLGPRDRIHVVVVNDPEVGKRLGTVTVVCGDHLDRIAEVCGSMEDPFHLAIKKAAFTQVCFQIWGGMPPDGAEFEQVFEVSRQELTDIMRSEMDHRAEMAARDAS